VLVIANGFNKFHLALAAAEAHRRGLLTCFITGAYPTPLVRRALALGGLGRRNRRLARLAARREAIPDELVCPIWTAEAVYFVAMAARNAARRSALRLNAWSFRYCGRHAVRSVRQAAARGARLYHYRSGFGHESVREARRLGMATLCDHSIAHPAFLPALIAGNGRMPRRCDAPGTDRLWSEILEDLEQADAVLVNSEFVRRTFLYAGHDPARVHVIYLGVDDAYLESLPARSASRACAGPLRMLFAGVFDRRKGADAIIDALRVLDDVPWTLEIAGNLGQDMARRDELLRDRRVVVSGWLPRGELARRMVTAEVFLFPSLAEGSARVVFEALAAGCYVITTPNAGSIVEDQVHGRLVAPGDPEQLAAAIREAASNRGELTGIGRRNATLVRAKYRQRDYGDKLAALYAQLLGTEVVGS
jgi:glycosyltransferase involved in cell wall biosynthesis